ERVRRRHSSARFHVVDGVGTQEVPEGPHKLLLRGDAHASGTESDGLAVPIGPINIDRDRPRVSAAERRGSLERVGPAGSTPAQTEPNRARALEIRQRAGSL